jgi:hypothetical protein
MKPETQPLEQNYMAPAVEWVRARGGCAQCAQDALKMTAGKAEPKDIRAALKGAGAPEMVFGLIWRHVFEATRSES